METFLTLLKPAYEAFLQKLFDLGAERLARGLGGKEKDAKKSSDPIIYLREKERLKRVRGIPRVVGLISQLNALYDPVKLEDLWSSPLERFQTGTEKEGEKLIHLLREGCSSVDQHACELVDHLSSAIWALSRHQSILIQVKDKDSMGARHHKTEFNRLVGVVRTKETELRNHLVKFQQDLLGETAVQS